MKNNTEIYSRVRGILLPLVVSLLGVTGGLSAKEHAIHQQLPNNDEMIVAYYGRPGVSSLGVLGKYTIDELIVKIKERVKEYERASGNHHILPAFDIIYGLAASDPGRDKDYILHLPHEKLMRYIDAAEKNNFALFLDLQLGGKTPLEAVKPVLKYLKYKNVHIAIDPEFEVKNLHDIRPGLKVGHISSAQLNQVQHAMSQYLSAHHIKKKKILVVHMFKGSMVTDKGSIEKYKNIDLIINLDGHGSPKLKVGIYNDIYKDQIATKFAGGFKLFFDEDKPSLMTPKQVLGLESVKGGSKIKHMPRYINYQ